MRAVPTFVMGRNRLTSCHVWLLSLIPLLLISIASANYVSRSTCAEKGCGGYDFRDPCQCDNECVDFDECCSDFDQLCTTSAPTSVPTFSSPAYQTCADEPCGLNAVDCTNETITAPSCQEQCSVQYDRCAQDSNCSSPSGTSCLSLIRPGGCSTVQCVVDCAFSLNSEGRRWLTAVADCVINNCVLEISTFNCVCADGWTGAECTDRLITPLPSLTPTIVPSLYESNSPVSSPSATPSTSPTILGERCTDNPCGQHSEGCIDVLSAAPPCSTQCSLAHAICEADSDCGSAIGDLCMSLIQPGGCTNTSCVVSCAVGFSPSGQAALTQLADCYFSECVVGIPNVSCTCATGFTGDRCELALAPTGTPSCELVEDQLSAADCQVISGTGQCATVGSLCLRSCFGDICEHTLFSEPPTLSPSVMPSSKPPTFAPSAIPSSTLPTPSPSLSPSLLPSYVPTAAPSRIPTQSPSFAPSLSPAATTTLSPTSGPTLSPTASCNDSINTSDCIVFQLAGLCEEVLVRVQCENTCANCVSLAPSTQTTQPTQSVHTVEPTASPSIVPSFTPSFATLAPDCLDLIDCTGLETICNETIVQAQCCRTCSVHTSTTVASSTVVSTTVASTIVSSTTVTSTNVTSTTITTLISSRSPTKTPTQAPSFLTCNDTLPDCETLRNLGFCEVPDINNGCLFTCTNCSTSGPEQTSTGSVSATSTVSSASSFAPSSTQTPTLIPSRLQSASPSMSPSLLSVPPSSIITSLPTSAPSQLPNTSPTESPTALTIVPSTSPLPLSAQPSEAPSKLPSLAPTSLPSVLPTERLLISTLTPSEATTESQASGAPSTQPTSITTISTTDGSISCDSLVDSLSQQDCNNALIGGLCDLQSISPLCLRTCCEHDTIVTSISSTTSSDATTTSSTITSSVANTPTSSNRPSNSPTEDMTESPTLTPLPCTDIQPDVTENCEIIRDNGDCLTSVFFNLCMTTCCSTLSPTSVPTTPYPTKDPTTASPTLNPTRGPTAPSQAPTSFPSKLPSTYPSVSPSLRSPSNNPTGMPSNVPSESPSNSPSAPAPSEVPSAIPTLQPTPSPSTFPTEQPTSRGPSPSPTAPLPTSLPSTMPTHLPTSIPSILPSQVPTSRPTSSPSLRPTVVPPPTSSVDGAVSLGFSSLLNAHQSPITLQGENEIHLTRLPDDRYGRGGPVRIQVAHLSESVQVNDVPAQAPLALNGTLIDDIVYSDWRNIRAAVQVTDSFGNTRTNRQVVSCVIRQNGQSATRTCRPDGTSGMCIATIVVPVQWLQSSTPINVECSIQGGSIVSLGSVLVMTPPVRTIRNNFLLKLPSRPLTPGALFSVTVCALTEYFVEAARVMIINDDSHIQFVGQSVENAEIWTTQVSSGGTGITNIAIVKSATADTSGIQEGLDSEIDFVTLQFRVRQDINTSINTTAIAIRVFELAAPVTINPGGQQINGAGSWVFGSAIGMNQFINQPGIISILEDMPVGLFGWPVSGSATMTNFAPLLQRAQSANGIIVQSLYRYGIARRTLNENVLTCETLGEGQMPVWSLNSCSSLTFQSTNTVGSSAIAIRAGYGTLNVSVSFKVWVPVNLSIPGGIVLHSILSSSEPGSSRLLAVENDCQARFGTKKLTIFSNFQMDLGQSIGPYDITDKLISTLMLDNENIAYIDVINHQLIGLQPGNTELRIGNTVFPVSVVDDGRLAFMSIHISLIEDIEIAASSISSVDGSDLFSQSILIEVSTVENITQVGVGGQKAIIVTATYTDTVDGTEYSEVLDSTMGLTLLSGDELVASITSNGQFIQANGGGSTSLTALWNESCEVDSFVNTTIDIVADIPLAIDAWVTQCGSSSRRGTIVIANGQDIAANLGESVEECIGATLQYPEYTRNVGGEASTTFAYAEGVEAESAVFLIQNCSSGTCIVAKPNVEGENDLVVYFAGEPVTARITVRVVRATSMNLLSSPYPPWFGSRTISHTRLRQIANTSVYQRAELHASVRFSDGRVVQLPQSTATITLGAPNVNVSGFQLQLLGSARNLTIARLGSSAVVSRVQQGEGTIVASFRFGGALLTSNLISISGDSDASPGVVVTSVLDVQVRRQNSGVTTIYGTPSSTSHSIIFGAHFEDGSRIDAGSMYSRFNAGFRQNLVTFQSSNPLKLQCNAQTGVLTLLQNSRESITLTVRAVLPDTANQTAASTVNVFTNLQAANLDIDLASSRSQVSSGSPLTSSVQVGDVLNVEVYVSSLSASLQTVQLEIHYDPQVFRFLLNEIRSGIDWTSEVLGNVDPVNSSRVAFGGATGTPVRGNLIHFATLRFEAIGSSTDSEFTGRILTIMDESGTFLRQTGTYFSAGSGVSTQVLGNRRRERDSLVSTTSILERAVERQRRSDCVVGVGPFPFGDVNSDCEWTFEEIGYVMNFTVYTLGLSDTSIWENENPWATIFPVMDANVDGAVEAIDVSILLRAWFGLARFVTEINQIQPASSNCGFSIDVSVIQGANAPDFSTNPSAQATTAVFAVVTAPSSLANSFGEIDSLPSDSGRFLGTKRAAFDSTRDVYKVDFPMSPTDEIGISVLLAVLTSDGWIIPFGGYYMAVGPRTAATAENTEGGAGATLVFGGDSIEWEYPFEFWPRYNVQENSSIPMCTTTTTTMSPTMLPTSLPSSPPTLRPTYSPTTPEPTVPPIPNPTASPTFTRSPTIYPGCVENARNCAVCGSRYDCDTCMNNTYLHEGQCYVTCPSGLFEQLGFNGMGGACMTSSPTLSPTRAPSGTTFTSTTTTTISSTTFTSATTITREEASAPTSSGSSSTTGTESATASTSISSITNAPNAPPITTIATTSISTSISTDDTPTTTTTTTSPWFRNHRIETAMPPLDGELDLAAGTTSDDDSFFDILPWIVAMLAIVFIVLLVLLVRRRRRTKMYTPNTIEAGNASTFASTESVHQINNPLFCGSPVAGAIEPYVSDDRSKFQTGGTALSLTSWEAPRNDNQQLNQWQAASNREIASAIQLFSKMLRTPSKDETCKPSNLLNPKDYSFVVKYIGSREVHRGASLQQLPDSVELFEHSRQMRESEPTSKRRFKLIIMNGQLELHPHGTLARMRGTIRRREISDEFFLKTTIPTPAFAGCYLDHHTVCLIVWHERVRVHELHMYQCRDLAHARKLEVYLLSFCTRLRSDSKGYRDIVPDSRSSEVSDPEQEVVGARVPLSTDSGDKWATSRKPPIGSNPTPFTIAGFDGSAIEGTTSDPADNTIRMFEAISRTSSPFIDPEPAMLSTSNLPAKNESDLGVVETDDLNSIKANAGIVITVEEPETFSANEPEASIVRIHAATSTANTGVDVEENKQHGTPYQNYGVVTPFEEFDNLEASYKQVHVRDSVRESFSGNPDDGNPDHGESDS